MSSEFDVPGRAGYLGVPLVLLPLIAVGAAGYYRDALPDFCVENAGKVLALVGVFEILLVAFLLYLRARRVTLRGGIVGYRSWFTNRSVAASEVTDLTVERELGGGSNDVVTVDRLIALWTGHGTALRLNLRYWDHAALRRLLRELVRLNPAIQLTPEVREFVQRPA